MQYPTTAILKPTTPGLRVAIPGTRSIVAPEGTEVTLDSYWHERIRDGSVCIVNPPTPVLETPPAPAREAERAPARETRPSPKKT